MSDRVQLRMGRGNKRKKVDKWEKVQKTLSGVFLEKGTENCSGRSQGTWNFFITGEMTCL